MDLRAALKSPPTGERARVDREGNCLVGSRCADCGTPIWPARAICHRCGSASVESVKFEPKGTLITYTTVHVPRDNLEVPYTLGQVRIDGDGPVVFGHVRGIDSVLPVPIPVRLGLAVDPADVPWYWFEPEGDSAI